MARFPIAEHVDLEPAAADFLEMLRELGHLDDAAIERLTGDLVSLPGARVVTLQDTRRAAAAHLFAAEAGMRPEARDVLMQEWSRLFG